MFKWLNVVNLEIKDSDREKKQPKENHRRKINCYIISENAAICHIRDNGYFSH